MGEESSDEIVLAERVENDSSEISMVEVVRTSQRPARKKRKRSAQTALPSKCRKRREVEKASDAGENFNPERFVDGSCSEGELFRVVVVDQDSRKTFHLRRTDTLESIYKAYYKANSPVKMKYKSVPVSRHLTLEEIGFDGDSCITVHRQRRISGVGIGLKINIDYAKTIEIDVCKELTVGDIFPKLEEMGFRGDLLVKNGVVLDHVMDVKDVVCTGDVIDLVSKDEIEYKI
ncbi:hypothetical protein EHEL_080420 [Encephalitozoon hellem ATCC 50504]|uniref:Ubiquitin-like domain-containing protein n=1 Tax=Encephalitozoon hellem TaxID=27973 RepID=A0A9Q9CB82_ENCHE|nr:uncharacterized protein EHEL_080420 [Encephalitozoon hellem ATCC 50504]AFM98747.2 hypothetical protein EHEL_080420 [Encephalitozoon hellem ATCC 50504]UTX43723.1 hypothetical protein GPU96_08g14920 [Encephalitozoon hellem]WEL39200.1 hypothetical protein PFJ87_08g00580 [Encephalitozoon hellem]